MSLRRISPLLAASLLTIAAQTSAAAAQALPQNSRWEFLVASGTLIPTGAQRDDIRRADLTSAQLTYVAQPHLAFTTAIGWARSRDVASESRSRLNVFSYDAGVEFRPANWTDPNPRLKPFAGFGAGGRTYDYRGADIGAQHQLAGYLGAGAELGIRRVRLRLELRDYLTGFTAVHGDGSRNARNEVVAMIGLRIIKRPAAQEKPADQ